LAIACPPTVLLAIMPKLWTGERGLRSRGTSPELELESSRAASSRDFIFIESVGIWYVNSYFEASSIKVAETHRPVA
jgi:hypothetical protein